MSELSPNDADECPEEMLSDLVNGELDPADKRRVAVHAAACNHCAQVLGGLFAARAALSVPAPGRLTLPHAFWQGIRAQLDHVDGLIRATNSGGVRRPLWARPVVAAALGILAVAFVARAVVVSRPGVLSQLARRHAEVTVAPGDPGLYQTVGYGLVNRWRPVFRSLVSTNGSMIVHTVYDVGGLPVSVFQMPELPLSEDELAPVQLGQETVYLGVLNCSSLAAIPQQGSWEVIIARTPPDDLLCLVAARPREVPLGPSM